MFMQKEKLTTLTLTTGYFVAMVLVSGSLTNTGYARYVESPIHPKYENL
jgi:hypothetical protein